MTKHDRMKDGVQAFVAKFHSVHSCECFLGPFYCWRSRTRLCVPRYTWAKSDGVWRKHSFSGDNQACFGSATTTRRSIQGIQYHLKEYSQVAQSLFESTSTYSHQSYNTEADCSCHMCLICHASLHTIAYCPFHRHLRPLLLPS